MLFKIHNSLKLYSYKLEIQINKFKNSFIYKLQNKSKTKAKQKYDFLNCYKLLTTMSLKHLYVCKSNFKESVTFSTIKY